MYLSYSSNFSSGDRNIAVQSVTIELRSLLRFPVIFNTSVCGIFSYCDPAAVTRETFQDNMWFQLKYIYTIRYIINFESEHVQNNDVCTGVYD
jgi:hypothetical protein